MKHAIILSLVVVAGFVGCRSTQHGVRHTAQPQAMVRTIDATYASQFQFLGTVEGKSGTGWTTTGDRRKAFNNLRAAVSDIGGNAVVKVDASSDPLYSSVEGDAYRCPTKQK